MRSICAVVLFNNRIDFFGIRANGRRMRPEFFSLAFARVSEG